MSVNKLIFKLLFYTYILAILLMILVTFYHIKVELNEEEATAVAIEKVLKNVNYAQLYRRPERLLNDVKYILLWNSPVQSPLDLLGTGQVAFIDHNCSFINCYVTDDRGFFGGDYKKFDAVVFNGHQVKAGNLPQMRSSDQIYIFADMESAGNYPVCGSYLDAYFNWTFTYRLDSDVPWRYFRIYDNNDIEVGPKREINWLETMEPINDILKNKLKTKSKSAAWFVSNCESQSGRESFVQEVQTELKKYNLTVDVYGECGPCQCARERAHECYKLLERDYYFYFAMENSFSEDYVTEKLLHALNHDTVPVVFGGADYSRFLPKGSYLNARTLGAAGLAHAMFELIQHPALYHHYFRWRNHYSYRNTGSYNDMCNLCAALNDAEKTSEHSSYQNFREWWNPKHKTGCSRLF